MNKKTMLRSIFNLSVTLAKKFPMIGLVLVLASFLAVIGLFYLNIIDSFTFVKIHFFYVSGFIYGFSLVIMVSMEITARLLVKASNNKYE